MEPEISSNSKFNTIQAVVILSVVGFIIATLFTASTPPGLLSGNLSESLSEAISSIATPTPEWPTPTARPRPRIGIVVGHWGDEDDPGAVCPDGLTELTVNQDIATIVQQYLAEEGFDVDLLKEFDPRLNGYQALALVSIHADSCGYVNDQARGYKVAASFDTKQLDKSARLASCIRNRYGQVTGMQVHNSITPDMSSYHAFGEVNENTPAAIIETGFMNLDRVLLTQNQDVLARGITNGVLCYIYNENVTNND